MSILERLEQMERRMAEMTGSQQHKQASSGGGGSGGSSSSGSGTGGGQAQVGPAVCQRQLLFPLWFTCTRGTWSQCSLWCYQCPCPGPCFMVLGLRGVEEVWVQTYQPESQLLPLSVPDLTVLPGSWKEQPRGDAHLPGLGFKPVPLLLLCISCQSREIRA